MENSKQFKAIQVDKTKIIDLEKGKLPPQLIDIEAGVIGGILANAKAIEDVAGVFINPDVFYKDNHRVIFEAAMSLFNAGNPVDLLTISAELRRNGNLERAGGDFNLIQFTQKIASSAHIEYHSRLILQKYMARQVISFSSLMINLAYDEHTDIFELLARWQNEFDSVMDYINTGRDTMTFPQALQNLKKEVEMLTANKDEVKLVGIHTGFRRINKYTGGYRKQDLVIIAARPGMGKTSYVLKCAIENCKLNVGVGMISLEMSIEQLTARCVAIDTNFHLKQLLKTGFEKKEYFTTYGEHQDRMNKYPFYVDDSGKTDIADVVIRAKMMVRKYGIKVLIIDYLQLMTNRMVKGNRESEVSSISRRLKSLAKELNIPIIALSQLSRAVETRGSSKRPMLSDLRDSGSIEQDADIVQFLYRPEYYKIDIDRNDYDEDMHPLIDAGADSEIIFAKYRGGSLNTTMLKWQGDKTKYLDVTCPDDMQVYEEHYESKPLPSVNPADAFDDNNGIAF
jgi:replicative DNA helicase